MLKLKTIRIPVYGSKVLVALTNDTTNNKLAQRLSKRGFPTKPEDFNQIDGVQLTSQTPTSLKLAIVIRLNKNTTETAIHETYHLTQTILEHHGVDYRKGSNNEAYAYLMGNIATKILKLCEQVITNQSKRE